MVILLKAKALLTSAMADMLQMMPQSLATGRCAIEPGLALRRFRQSPGHQPDDGATEFDNWRREHLGRATGKNAQVFKYLPMDDFLSRYRLSCREPRTCLFGQGDKRLPLRRRPGCVEREPKIRNTCHLAPRQHGPGQPRCICLPARLGGIDKVFEENT